MLFASTNCTPSTSTGTAPIALPLLNVCTDFGGNYYNRYTCRTGFPPTPSAAVIALLDYDAPTCPDSGSGPSLPSFSRNVSFYIESNVCIDDGSYASYMYTCAPTTSARNRTFAGAGCTGAAMAEYNMGISFGVCSARSTDVNNFGRQYSTIATCVGPYANVSDLAVPGYIRYDYYGTDAT